MVSGTEEFAADTVGTLYAPIPNNATGDQTVIRASGIATRVNSSGAVETVAVNKARIDYSLGIDRCPNLLVERASTNLFATPLAPATQTVTVVNATVYTISVVGSGSITLSGAGTGEVTQNNPITITSGTTSLVCTVAGTLSGASVVAGQVALSVSDGAKDADSISKTGLSASIPQVKGALFFDGYLQAGSLTDGHTRIPSSIAITGLEANNTILFYRYNNVIGYEVNVGGVFQANGNVTILSPLKDKRIKLYISFDTNNVSFYVNGAVALTDLVATIPACNKIEIGGGALGSNWDGLIKSVMVTDELTLTDIEQLSQYATFAEMASEMQYILE